MTTQKKCTATRAAASACALLVLLLVGRSANAEPVGTVTVSTGLLLARAGGQSLKVLVAGSTVEAGETFFTRADTYSEIRLGGNSSIALGPDSELTIERYSTDSASIRLINGRVRIASGLPGTRGGNNLILQAGDATLTVQHGTFVAEYIQRASSEVARQDVALRQRRMAVLLSSGHSAGPYRQVALSLAQAVLPANPTGARAPGLYVQVLDGMVNLSNTGGSLNFAAGQFGYVPSLQTPPVILPSNPGMQFNPPPVFNSSMPNGAQNTPSSGKSGGVDCEVR